LDADGFEELIMVGVAMFSSHAMAR